ncbi:MAG TPA: LysR family transcriptional regulator [Conexibacter sp.]|nr:LysR family transcriptional regulator [Conexibacter sp.]
MPTVTPVTPSSEAAQAFLNLRLLRYWTIVVEEGSLTAGAQRLGLTQPSLSQQVRALEAWFGGALLERTASGVRLTPAGRALLPEARAILAAAERARRVTREALELEAGMLEIATYPSLAAARLLPAVRQWHERHVGVAISLRELSHRTLADSVRRGFGDLGVGAPPPAWSGPLEHLGWEELVVVLPAGDPALAEPGPLSLATLAEREWVLYEREVALSDLQRAACAHAGFQPRGAAETSHVETAARLAAAGVGPALVTASNAPAELAPTVRRLRPAPVWEVAAFTRGEWSPAAAAFLELARDERGWDALPEDPLVIPLG